MNPLGPQDKLSLTNLNTTPIAHSKKTDSSPKLLNKVLSVIKNIKGNFKTMALSFKAKSQHNTYEECVLASYKGQAQKMREPFQHKHITAFQKSILNDINDPKGIKFKQAQVNELISKLERIQQGINESETLIQKLKCTVSALLTKRENLLITLSELPDMDPSKELTIRELSNVATEIRVQNLTLEGMSGESPILSLKAQLLKTKDSLKGPTKELDSVVTRC